MTDENPVSTPQVEAGRRGLCGEEQKRPGCVPGLPQPTPPRIALYEVRVAVYTSRSASPATRYPELTFPDTPP